ncbi:MAG: acyl-CoA dehydrogenase C-terminal domain-containing protein [Pseudomonadota bacterium]
MATYQIPHKEMMFLLNDVWKVEADWAQYPDFTDVSMDLASAVLEEGGKLSRDVLFPLNRSGDEEGCEFNNGVVKTPKGFTQAYTRFAEGGWCGLGGDPEFGGQGLPKTLVVLFEEMLFSANQAFALYPILTSGAALALLKHGDDELKGKYLAKLYSGEWSGAMCLTEPHAGSDLGIIRTKAIPKGDGSYEISGTKIFITGGEHDLTSNIIHLVLAKLPNAPAGSRGISMFLVPKYLLNAQNDAGDANALSCGSIEHKMGIKGSATCVMNFDGARGWLVGEENFGLQAMFTMMNYERLSIALQGLGSAEMAYQHAAEYAKDRTQGRSSKGAQSPHQVADSILVHPDVRRMLLSVRAFCEAGRAFAIYVASQLDHSKYHPDADQRKRAEDLVSLLTPVAKAFLTDVGLDMCVVAQQVFGGHGYVREWSVEQLVRDTRIAQIYEGTNGIQALDLVGRKILRSGGQLLTPFLEDVDATIQIASANSSLASHAKALRQKVDLLRSITDEMVSKSKADPELAAANACDYLHSIGYIALGFAWLKMLIAAEPQRESDPAFFGAKSVVGQFYFDRLLPKVDSLGEIARAGSQNIMQLAPEAF